jgi:agmatine deiminase
MGLAILGNRLLFEGGDLVTNGRGFGVLSSRVVDANTTAPDRESREIVLTVASMLGLENVLLVPPLLGESSGHADMFCNFLGPDLIVVGSYDPEVDAENAHRLDEIAADLEGLATLAGPLRVERISLPDHADGVWRSYTTVVFANGVVLVPVYPDHCPELDAQAQAFYRRLLPDREIVAIDASRLSRMNGSLRCITLNVPVGGPLAAGRQ